MKKGMSFDGFRRDREAGMNGPDLGNKSLDSPNCKAQDGFGGGL